MSLVFIMESNCVLCEVRAKYKRNACSIRNLLITAEQIIDKVTP